MDVLLILLFIAFVIWFTALGFLVGWLYGATNLQKFTKDFLDRFEYLLEEVKTLR